MPRYWRSEHYEDAARSLCHMLRSQRTLLGFTQADVAAQLGTTQPVISKLEDAARITEDDLELFGQYFAWIMKQFL